MSLKLLSAAFLATSLAFGGAAYAQTDASTDSSEQADHDSDAIMSDTTIMGGFFTDDSMETMRSEEEVRSAYDAMPTESQKQMKQECIDMQSSDDSAAQSTTLMQLCEQVAGY